MSDEKISTVVTQTGATVAVVPGVAELLSMQWWNANSAGVVAICAAIGATVSLTSFITGQWQKGNVQRLFKRLLG